MIQRPTDRMMARERFCLAFHRLMKVRPKGPIPKTENLTQKLWIHPLNLEIFVIRLETSVLLSPKKRRLWAL